MHDSNIQGQIDRLKYNPTYDVIVMFTITPSGTTAKSIGHNAGEYVASFDNKHFFGRDSLREIIDTLGLTETEVEVDGGRLKVFHNDDVAIVMTKDPWVDYPRGKNGEKIKRDVYKEEWGGRLNPLRPARAGYIRIVGDRGEVVRAYNLIAWRSLKNASSMNGDV